MTSTISKIRVATGKTLRFHDAHEQDAAFILDLRMQKGGFLSPTSSALEDQVAWLRAYATRSDEAYFVIRSIAGEPIGTVRLYDPLGSSFCWGSWILKDDTPSSAAIESALMVYRLAVDQMGFTSAHFEVDRHNERVWAFHERFGATRVGETEHEFKYKIGLEAIRRSLDRYARFLPLPLTISDRVT